MFYSEYVLTKKGPYAKIWLAAHLDNKLTKNQIAETDIVQSVESITQPVVPIALRTSGHLLLGVVKIYRRKVKYVLNECNETMTRIKLQVVPQTKVDLPEKLSLATFGQITLPEKLSGDLDMMLPDIDLQMLTAGGAQAHTHHFRQLVDDLDEWYTEETPVDESPGPYTQSQIQRGDETEVVSLGSMDRARRERTPLHDLVDLPPIDIGEDFISVTPGKLFQKTPSTGTTITAGEIPLMPDIPDAFFDQGSEFGQHEDGTVPRSEPRREPGVTTRKRKRAVIQDSPNEIPDNQFQEILKDTRDLKRRRQNATIENIEMGKILSVKDIFQTPASSQFMPESLVKFFQNGFQTDKSNLSEVSSQIAVLREAELPAEFDLPPQMDLEDLPVFDTPSISKAPIPDTEDSSDFVSRMQLPQSAQPNRIGELETQLRTPLSNKGLESQTITCVAVLLDAFEKADSVNTRELLADSNKLTAAQVFYQILLLKSRGYIDAKQDSPLGDIVITKTANFSDLTAEVA